MTANTRCRNNPNSESGIETLVECQTLCLQNNNCVGVSFSTYWATHSPNHGAICAIIITKQTTSTTILINGQVMHVLINDISGQAFYVLHQLQNIACLNILGSSCKCKDLVLNGNGNCQTNSTSATHQGKRFCYVELPSNCIDLVDSTEQPGEKFSAEPCSSGICDLLLA